ncbi:hypothetical protein D9M68_649540 [compost metagenome]
MQAVVDQLGFVVGIQAHTQFTEVLDFRAGLHHRGAAVDQHRLRQGSVRMAADDDIDARHLLDQLDLFAAPAAVILPGHTHVREQDHHVDFFFLAQLLHHGLCGGNRIGEGQRLDHRADRHRVVAEQAEQAEADAALVDHLVRQDAPGLGMCLQAVVVLAHRVETQVARQQRQQRLALGLVRGADHCGQAGRAKIELVVAQGRGVVAQLAEQTQLAADLAGDRVEQRAHAEIAAVEQQHRLLPGRRAPLFKHAGETGDAADRVIVIQRGRAVLVVRAEAEQARLPVVGVEDGETAFGGGRQTGQQ